MMFDYQQYIERNPQISGGVPVVRGTRVPVRTILASLAEGSTIAEIITDFPTVNREEIRAIIAFAAASTAEDMPLVAAPSFA